MGTGKVFLKRTLPTQETILRTDTKFKKKKCFGTTKEKYYQIKVSFLLHIGQGIHIQGTYRTTMIKHPVKKSLTNPNHPAN